MAFTDYPLFLRTLGKPTGPGEPDAAPRTRLREALFRFRERAATLAGEIHRDLPDFTVHDISHLDALWEMADLIAGPNYPLNPLEAFTLGGVFLLHDLGLGLAAYPGGRKEIQQGLGWQDVLSSHLRKHLGRAPNPEELASPPPEIERAAVLERLRVLHAERAEKLALASWETYHLIDDPDLRLSLGPLLGRIAHSHWWPVSRLANEFGTVVGALPDCPGDWTLDPLKIAILLRTADAAHLDARRAPGFLRALRGPEGIAQDHWRFQEHLLKPRVEDDRLVYTTARPFTPEEVDAWSLCEEILRMVDGELHQVDSLLADLHRPELRLRVRGVKGAESPRRLAQLVKVSGWTPVDARIHVSNVADLARQLGGESLYGRDPHVPLRELIQNASDAVRARRLLQDRPQDWGRVTVRLGEDDQGSWVEVEDTGIGMSEAVLIGPLLDFGTTYWGSALMKEEHEGLWAKGFEPTGRFGIGFFSVFMWGRRVRVTTRRYEDAQRDTRVLEFRTGLETRPFVRSALPEEQLQDGGTRVRVWLNKRPDEEGGLLRPWHDPWGRKREPEDLAAICAWLAPALDVDLYVDDGEGIRRAVAAADWLTMDAAELFARVSLKHLPIREVARDFGPLLRLLYDSAGKVVGRAAIFHTGGTSSLNAYPQGSMGVITIGGLRADNVDGIAGILAGSAKKAARDSATPLANVSFLKRWASDQAHLIFESISSPRLQMTCATSVLLYGGDPGELPIAKRGQEFVNQEELSCWRDAPDEVALFSFGLDHSSIGDKRITLHPHVLGIHEGTGLRIPQKYPGCSSIDLIIEALAEAWGCATDDIWSQRKSGRYEIGFRGEDIEESWRVMIIRKPLPDEDSE